MPRTRLGGPRYFGHQKVVILQDTSVVRLLLENGADVNARAMDGSTPLHNASFLGTSKVCLLKHGAHIEAKDDGGQTALQIAVEEGGSEVLESLREHGAK